MRIAALCLCGLLLSAPLLAGDESGSAVLNVSATVVSSCSVAVAEGQVVYHCARGARGPVRVNGQSQSAPAREAPVEHTSVNYALVTIDF